MTKKTRRDQIIDTLEKHGERRGSMKCIADVCYDEKSDRIIIEYGRGCPKAMVEDHIKHALSGSEVTFKPRKKSPDTDEDA